MPKYLFTRIRIIRVCRELRHIGIPFWVFSLYYWYTKNTGNNEGKDRFILFESFNKKKKKIMIYYIMYIPIEWWTVVRYEYLTYYWFNWVIIWQQTIITCDFDNYGNQGVSGWSD